MESVVLQSRHNMNTAIANHDAVKASKNCYFETEGTVNRLANDPVVAPTLD